MPTNLKRNGLLKLDQEHQVPDRKSKMFERKGIVHGNYFYLGDKPGGVEPGFIAVEIDELFLQRFNTRLNQNFTMTQCKAHLKLIEKTNPEYLSNFAQQLADEGKGKVTTPSEPPKLKMWLIKQDYKDPNILGIAPPLRRLAGTNRIKSTPEFLKKTATYIYSIIRRTNPDEENTNAILECLANDVARAYGMNVQNQHLIFGTYKSGNPKIMTACEWESGLEMIEGKLAGSKDKNTYENYLVEHDNKKNAVIDQNGHLKSDNSIKNLGECLPLFIAQGDRDALGSQGQNKGRKGDALFGFDFGHAYRRNNPLLSTLKDDFSFTQPKDENKKFKNLSLFDDTLMSDRMTGMFFLYKMMAPSFMEKIGITPEEAKNISNAIEQYKIEKPGFAERWNQVEENSLEKIFDEYINKFTELAKNDFSTKNEKYKDYINNIKQAKQRALDANINMLRIFKNKMQISPAEVDLLHNLTKLTSNTSLLSSDGKVALNHLHVSPENKILWKIEKKNGLILLSADVNKKMAAEVQEKISQFMQANHQSITTPALGKNTIQYTIPSEDFPNFMKVFQEENIIKFKTPTPEIIQDKGVDRIVKSTLERNDIDIYCQNNMRDDNRVHKILMEYHKRIKQGNYPEDQKNKLLDNLAKGIRIWLDTAITQKKAEEFLLDINLSNNKVTQEDMQIGARRFNNAADLEKILSEIDIKHKSEHKKEETAYRKEGLNLISIYQNKYTNLHTNKKEKTASENQSTYEFYQTYLHNREIIESEIHDKNNLKTFSENANNPTLALNYAEQIKVLEEKHTKLENDLKSVMKKGVVYPEIKDNSFTGSYVVYSAKTDKIEKKNFSPEITVLKNKTITVLTKLENSENLFSKTNPKIQKSLLTAIKSLPNIEKGMIALTEALNLANTKAHSPEWKQISQEISLIMREVMQYAVPAPEANVQTQFETNNPEYNQLIKSNIEYLKEFNPTKATELEQTLQNLINERNKILFESSGDNAISEKFHDNDQKYNLLKNEVKELLLVNSKELISNLHESINKISIQLLSSKDIDFKLEAEIINNMLDNVKRLGDAKETKSLVHKAENLLGQIEYREKLADYESKNFLSRLFLKKPQPPAENKSLVDHRGMVHIVKALNLPAKEVSQINTPTVPKTPPIVPMEFSNVLKENKLNEEQIRQARELQIIIPLKIRTDQEIGLSFHAKSGGSLNVETKNGELFLNKMLTHLQGELKEMGDLGKESQAIKNKLTVLEASIKTGSLDLNQNITTILAISKEANNLRTSNPKEVIDSPAEMIRRPR